ncbi:hypothetical protein [Aureimonas populi]|uniref:Uncharacterized protein n=1 Tax=Aureimonas populi TaxID=1701758 RepID=A0ABW5CKP6_9HYPH|nr:hypothetical protein [Aureimonas populi]
MSETHPFVAELEGAARESERAEAEFRRTMNARVAELARQRAFAFRRMNLMKSLFSTVGQAPSQEIALAAALAALRTRLGWVEDSPAREEVLGEYAKVAASAFAELHPEGAGAEGAQAPPVLLASLAPEGPAVNTRTALERFEAWYGETRSTPFWVLFEHYMPETQLVDF